MRPREWKMYVHPEGDIDMHRFHDCDDELISVREVVPDSITITRQQLRWALKKPYPIRLTDFGATKRELLEEFYIDVEYELFGSAAQTDSSDAITPIEDNKDT